MTASGNQAATADVTIDSVQTPEQLQRVWAFALRNLELPAGKSTLAYYTEQLSVAPGLLVFAEAAGEVCGCVLGDLEDDHVRVGAVAVAESLRRRGVGAAMMQRLEAEARQIGQHTLILGARQEAETFYLRCGFQPHLFIQAPAPATPAALRALREGCEVAWEAEEEGFTKLLLRTPTISRELQHRYDEAFPGCSTQYVFTKHL